MTPNERAANYRRRNKVRVAEIKRNSRRKHAAKISEYNKKYRAEHLVELKARLTRYQKLHAARRAAQQNARRAMQMQQRCGCCSDNQFERLYDAAALVPAEVDHCIPLWLGGHHCTRNLQVLMPKSHSEKTTNDLRRVREAKQRNVLLRQWPIAA